MVFDARGWKTFKDGPGSGDRESRVQQVWVREALEIRWPELRPWEQIESIVGFFFLFIRLSSPPSFPSTFRSAWMAQPRLPRSCPSRGRPEKRRATLTTFACRNLFFSSSSSSSSSLYRPQYPIGAAFEITTIVVCLSRFSYFQWPLFRVSTNVPALSGALERDEFFSLDAKCIIIITQAARWTPHATCVHLPTYLPNSSRCACIVLQIQCNANNAQAGSLLLSAAPLHFSSSYSSKFYYSRLVWNSSKCYIHCAMRLEKRFAQRICAFIL